MRKDDVVDEIIYGRVLIALQRMQLDAQDRKLRNHLGEAVADCKDRSELCQESLKRAWARASDNMDMESMGIDEITEFSF